MTVQTSFKLSTLANLRDAKLCYLVRYNGKNCVVGSARGTSRNPDDWEVNIEGKYWVPSYDVTPIRMVPSIF